MKNMLTAGGFGLRLFAAVLENSFLARLVRRIQYSLTVVSLVWGYSVFFSSSVEAQKTNNVRTVAPQIYYGASIPDSNLPIAYLYVVTTDGYGGTCTGVVLNNRTVLTAAHCLEGNLSAIYVVAGGRSVAYGITYDIHPRYVPLVDGPDFYSSSQFDLGYVKLDRKLPKSVKTIKVAKHAPKAGEPLYVFGYGYDEYGSIGGLKLGVMQYAGTDGLNLTALRPSGGSHACGGDSGGPAMILRKKKLYLVGLNAFGDCSSLNVFTSVLSSPAKKFIKTAKKKLRR